MAGRLKSALVALALATSSAPLAGQALTLGDLVASAELGRRVAELPRVDPSTDAILARNVERLARSRVLTRPLADIVGEASHPDLLGRARFRQRSYDFRLPDSLGAVLDTVLLVVNGEMHDALQGRVTEAEIQRIRAPFDSLLDAQLRRSLDESAERLRRFEIMYGPGSAKLNWVEALLNYGTQWVPGFGVDPLAGPRPFELVAAYTSTYLTTSDGKARALSAAETGVRMYIFARGWGGDGRVSGVLKPRHVAAGWAFTGPDDVGLQAPWRDGSRSGPFVSWGDLKAAYILGRECRVLVTRQLQLIPLVF